MGVAHSTLDNWRRAGEVLALPKGRRSHVIPMEQFHDGRPLPGIRQVLHLAYSDPVVAWRWLRTPHVDFIRLPPISVLRDGRLAEVESAASSRIHRRSMLSATSRSRAA